MLFYLKFSENFFADFFWQIHKYFQLINMYVPITGVLNHFLNLLANILMFISNKKNFQRNARKFCMDFKYLFVGLRRVQQPGSYCDG